MGFFVIDTNVPVVANAKSEQADPECVIACIDALFGIRENGIIILDDARLILQEYMHNLSMSGQPGAGDSFMKWVWDMQANEKHCKRVHITPGESDPTDFAEFPKDDRLQNFDPSDRKFVTVALTSGDHPEILNAVDSDWANHFDALTQAGLRIRFVCPQHVSPRK